MEPPGLYVELWQRQDLQGADVMTEPRRGGGRREDGVKFVIISAEDLGYGDGINRAVAVLHDLGRVTSASLMVNTTGTAQAVAIAAARPRLSLGLHVNFTNEDDRLVEFDDPAVCRRELRRQFDHFVTLTGRRPTHLNSHHHVHRRPACRPSFQELADEHNLPLRDRPPVVFKGGFYGDSGSTECHRRNT